ncbi:MAG: hypothetical protein CLLPBCKN_003921 [Chroococcidiopsis cubana SAG 39.79]|jgi:hypothetical protein|uniref:Uncharacterized protein n=2 Tax=Chroococcidiopsidaceae TaxID=1890528 RepID=A0AB37U9F5_9CYAN|nr:hypothetical protein [Chroococcidiopsis cubana SAG 39.79]PSB63287.1 hypothetical protein C7B79_14500 [Chroococcidiopsis cubana CCALA 043]RUT01654.1 hypothetical protein DSM107010_64980 [Chroococcidiopsis cubana SAG 39.79]
MVIRNYQLPTTNYQLPIPIDLMVRFVNWLRSGSLRLLVLAGIILLIWGMFSPVGTLVWWLSQEVESLGLKPKPDKQLRLSGSSNSQAQSANINCYIVFLTGVGDFSANQLLPGEEVFLNRLEQAHPNCVTVRDVFPYSAANESLGGERFLAPLWRFADEAKGWYGVADVLIKIRNLWRFAISADDRYGKVYNLGIANAIVDRMQAAHPLSQTSQQPIKILLMGTSGGAQVALAATPYLARWLPNTQIAVVSIGGVFGGTDGFNTAEQIYHLQGQRDWVEDIGRIIFPSRWIGTVGSPFNQAVRQGRYTVHSSGPHEHDGAEGYFGMEIVGEKGMKYVDLTLQKVNQLPIWSQEKSSVKYISVRSYAVDSPTPLQLGI